MACLTTSPTSVSISLFSHRCLRLGAAAALLTLLAACASRTPDVPVPTDDPRAIGQVEEAPPTGPAIERERSRWTPVRWADLPGFEADDLGGAWDAWVRSCERPGTTFAPLCSQVRRLALGTDAERRAWMRARLQPYRVQARTGQTQGLLTGYYEPLFEASRHRQPGFQVPLYAPPHGHKQGKRWYTRQQMEQNANARAQLAGREIVWLREPVESMILQIQGSGRALVHEPDGSQQVVRLAFGGTNGHPYSSPGRWLLAQGVTDDATWPGIRAALAANPHLERPFMWSNPRVIFFKEERIDAADSQAGPKGAQGVPLTPGRSIAVDPKSIPYGTPVWLASSGPAGTLQRLVLAQDTGSAITGAVRADYFAGLGDAAGEVAGHMRQPLQLWVLWPK